MKLIFLEMIINPSKILVFIIFISGQSFASEVKIYQPAQPHSKYIAVVGDIDTCTSVLEELNDYIKTVSSEGYGTHLLCDRWDSSNKLKKDLYKLFDKKGIEGALLFGNLPDVKINASDVKGDIYNKLNYKISDFFYENFSLKFSLISRDDGFDFYFIKDVPEKYKRDIYVSRVQGDIHQFFLNAAEEHKKERKSKVDYVTGFFDRSYFGGSGYALKADAEVMKETIMYFYSLKNLKVTYNYKDDDKDSIKRWKQEKAQIAMLLFSGNKDDYIENNRSKLIIASELDETEITNYDNSKFQSMIVFNHDIHKENIIPPSYYMLFSGHRVGGYYRNIESPFVKLYGDPLFAYEKSDKITLDPNSNTRLSNLFILKRWFRLNNNISPDSVKKLLSNKDEKIRYETCNWAKKNNPMALIKNAGIIMLDPSDRVFKLFIEVVSGINKPKSYSILSDGLRYFRFQGDDVREKIIFDTLKKSKQGNGKKSTLMFDTLVKKGKKS